MLQRADKNSRPFHLARLNEEELQMKHSQKLGAAVAMTAAAGLVLSGCASGGSDPSGPVTLTLWRVVGGLTEGALKG